MSDTPPQHIALIPDGNRRWAKARGLDPWKGHEEGVKRFEELGDSLLACGVKYYTFWAASEDNLLKRSKLEVSVLLRIVSEYLYRSGAIEQFQEKGIRVRVLGRWKELISDKKVHEGIERVEQATALCAKANLTLLLGYDGRSEMVAALNHLSLTKQVVDAATLRAALWTADLPPVDLVIRTGGEPHWSAGFMMWHVANSQLYFTEKLWPDFNAHELQTALDDFHARGRRFGK